ncbi:PstS family phosphate ABC transporter substrate-binding protein [Bacillus sp. FJAT-18017]|uniref:PstS family phosphate ABC transporter substrate-binding protein n=1 Tax=Bacillus sp. FJAT-18017 TaxID=1705566 RepID=UPI000AD1AFAE|nr:substrate-binding domain-containing protein [Bacillus sp. FJAT-18017]
MKRNTVLVVMFFIVAPLVLSFGSLGIMMVRNEEIGYPVLLLYIAGAVFAAHQFAKNDKASISQAARYIPVAIPAFVAAFLAALLMIITKGFLGADWWGVYVFGFFPFLPNSFITFLTGQHIAGLLAPFLYYSTFLVSYMVYFRNNPLRMGAIFSGTTAFIVCFSVIGIVHWQRSQEVLPSYGFEYGNGYSSVDLEPYYVNYPDNRLPRLDEPASFQIDKKEEMPVLDGAEAAFPVYSAFANEVYSGIGDENYDKKRQVEIVSFTNTIYAFERLVNGEVDVFFGAQPSQAQKELAERSDKELVMTPIGKEAFVFFVNSKNPVNNLTTDQIKGIYSGKITNWSKAGGNDDKIIAFQRPEDSGSQTIMQVVMGDTPLMNPLKEEIMGMGDLIEEVANYRNYKNSLGYSFRFFATGMNPNKEIKLISVDGIEPSEENIRSGKYPFVVNLYAVTLKDNPNKNLKPFLEWMEGPQGQYIVGEIGYVPLN